MGMSARNRKRRIEVMKKEGPEFERWLKNNLSDRECRDWYREDIFSRNKWLTQSGTEVQKDKSEEQ